jgi:hypothetical protein
MSDWILKGSITEVSKDDGIYEVIAQAPIEDSQGQKLDLQDIIRNIPIMKAIGGGAIILTYGHTDLPCARSLEESVVLIKDNQTGKEYPALKLKYQIIAPEATRAEIIKDHQGSPPRIRGVSIRGKKLDSVLTCKDAQCTSVLETITKGEYYSFALCTDPINRLSIRLDQPDAPEIIAKARDHVTDGKCPLCLETIEFYISKGYDRITSEIIVKEALDLYKPKAFVKQKENVIMEKPEVIAIVKEELKPVMEALDKIEKAQKPIAAPAPAPKDSEEVEKLKKANDDLIAKVKEYETLIAKAQAGKADPKPEANSGVSGPVSQPQGEMIKGALQGSKDPVVGLTEDEANNIKAGKVHRSK